MATYVEINGVQYPAVITGRLNDHDWNNRASKAITVEMDYANAVELFVDDVKWNIVQDVERQEEKIAENGDVTFETVIEREVHDNSDYGLAGDIIDHRNGKVTAKMGKLTAEEMLKMVEGVL